MRSFLIASAALCWMTTSALAGGLLPTQADVQSTFFLKQACFKLQVQMTRLPDLTAFPPTQLPLCFELPEVRATGNCSLITTATPPDYSCPVELADTSHHYVRVWSGTYSFYAYISDTAFLEVNGTFPKKNGKDPGCYLCSTTFVDLDDVWNYHLSNLLMHYRSELPVPLASLIVNFFEDSASGVGVFTNLDRPGAKPAVDLQDSYPPLDDLQALGYDADGTEYGIHITTRLDTAG